MSGWLPPLSLRRSKEILIKCGADTPVRVKVSIVHTFRYKQILVQSLTNCVACTRNNHRNRVSGDRLALRLARASGDLGVPVPFEIDEIALDLNSRYGLG
jgi:hypothetical protein